MNIPPPAEHLFNVDADWGKSEAGRPQYSTSSLRDMCDPRAKSAEGGHKLQ